MVHRIDVALLHQHGLLIRTDENRAERMMAEQRRALGDGARMAQMPHDLLARGRETL